MIFMVVGFACQNCKYLYKKLKKGWKVCCEAYPDGIPNSVLLHIERENLKDCGKGFKYIPIDSEQV